MLLLGHNYKNGKHFSNLSKLENGDIVKITDNNKQTLEYKVYDKYEIKESDFSCLEQNTNGRKELTLITCLDNNNKKRLVIKCLAE